MIKATLINIKTSLTLATLADTFSFPMQSALFCNEVAYLRVSYLSKQSTLIESIKTSMKMRYNTDQTERSYFDFVVPLSRLNFTFLLMYISSKNAARADIINK